MKALVLVFACATLIPAAAATFEAVMRFANGGDWMWPATCALWALMCFVNRPQA